MTKRFAGVLFVVLLFGLFFVSIARAQVVAVDQFKGDTVADKLTAAMDKGCNPDRTILCSLRVSSNLAFWSTGTLPALCMNCVLDDKRGGAPGGFVEMVIQSSSTTFSMAAAAAPFGSAANMWRKFDATAFSQFRLCTHVSALSAASLRVQYSTDNVTFVDAENGATGDVSLGSAGARCGAWATLKMAPRGDVYWRIVVSGGDGTTRNLSNTVIQFKP
jgi:hypothetical protein